MSDILDLSPKADELTPPQTVAVRLANGDEFVLRPFPWHKLQKAIKLARPIFEALGNGAGLGAAVVVATDAITEILALALNKSPKYFEDDSIDADQVQQLFAVIWTLNQEQLKKALPALLTGLAAKNPAAAAQLTEALNKG